VQAENVEKADDPDSVPSSPSSSEASSSGTADHASDLPFGSSKFSQAEATGDFQSLGAERAGQKKSALREYVEQFDQQTMVEMTRIVSAEGAALVEAQTSALFGDLKQLQRQMQVCLCCCIPIDG
jgi:hypothetical protein